VFCDDAVGMCVLSKMSSRVHPADVRRKIGNKKLDNRSQNLPGYAKRAMDIACSTIATADLACKKTSKKGGCKKKNCKLERDGIKCTSTSNLNEKLRRIVDSINRANKLCHKTNGQCKKDKKCKDDASGCRDTSDRVMNLKEELIILTQPKDETKKKTEEENNDNKWCEKKTGGCKRSKGCEITKDGTCVKTSARIKNLANFCSKSMCKAPVFDDKGEKVGIMQIRNKNDFDTWSKKVTSLWPDHSDELHAIYNCRNENYFCVETDSSSSNPMNTTATTSSQEIVALPPPSFSSSGLQINTRPGWVSSILEKDPSQEIVAVRHPKQQLPERLRFEKAKPGLSILEQAGSEHTPLQQEIIARPNPEEQKLRLLTAARERLRNDRTRSSGNPGSLQKLTNCNLFRENNHQCMHENNKTKRLNKVAQALQLKGPLTATVSKAVSNILNDFNKFNDITEQNVIDVYGEVRSLNARSAKLKTLEEEIRKLAKNDPEFQSSTEIPDRRALNTSDKKNMTLLRLINIYKALQKVDRRASDKEKRQKTINKEVQIKLIRDETQKDAERRMKGACPPPYKIAELTCQHDKICWSPESQYLVSPPNTVSPEDLEFAVRSSRKRAFDITSDIISQLLEAMSIDAVSGVQASFLPELAGLLPFTETMDAPEIDFKVDSSSGGSFDVIWDISSGAQRHARLAGPMPTLRTRVDIIDKLAAIVVEKKEERVALEKKKRATASVDGATKFQRSDLSLNEDRLEIVTNLQIGALIKQLKAYMLLRIHGIGVREVCGAPPDAGIPLIESREYFTNNDTGRRIASLLPPGVQICLNYGDLEEFEKWNNDAIRDAGDLVAGAKKMDVHVMAKDAGSIRDIVELGDRETHISLIALLQERPGGEDDPWLVKLKDLMESFIEDDECQRVMCYAPTLEGVARLTNKETAKQYLLKYHPDKAYKNFYKANSEKIRKVIHCNSMRSWCKDLSSASSEESATSSSSSAAAASFSAAIPSSAEPLAPGEDLRNRVENSDSPLARERRMAATSKEEKEKERKNMIDKQIELIATVKKSLQEITAEEARRKNVFLKISPSDQRKSH
jgi:hypothetical protein